MTFGPDLEARIHLVRDIWLFSTFDKVDKAMPSGADQALQAFNDVVNTDLFPRFLDPFVPERIRDTQPPDAGISRVPQVKDAYSRIVDFLSTELAV